MGSENETGCGNDVTVDRLDFSVSNTFFLARNSANVG